MKKEDYISITDYLQWASKNCRNSSRKNYHQLKKNDRRRVRRIATAHEIRKGKLYHKKSSKQVLTVAMARSVLKKLHQKKVEGKLHQNNTESMESFSKLYRFNARHAKELLATIVHRCEYCRYTKSLRRDVGPNYPLTKKQQKKACEKLGIQFRSQFKVDK